MARKKETSMAEQNILLPEMEPDLTNQVAAISEYAPPASDIDSSDGKGTGKATRGRTKRTPKSVVPKLGKYVLAIDGHMGFHVEADTRRNHLMDLMESMKGGKVLSGTVQGIETTGGTEDVAVLYHGDFKIIIPAREMVEPPGDFRGTPSLDTLNNMLNKRLGAEIDYIVKGIDPKSGIAAASRLDAMRAKRKEFFFTPDRDGNFKIYSGLIAEVRVTSVVRTGIFVDLFGLEVFVPIRELSYQRMADPNSTFSPGQRVLAKVLEVERIDSKDVRATLSIKQATTNPCERAIRKYSVGNSYVGTVSLVNPTGVFVGLDEGIDCLCSFPKRGRPPRGARVAVKILGIDYDANKIWGAIVHIAMPQ